MSSRTALHPKYRQLSDQLRQRVIVDNLVPGDRFMTVRQIAKQYAVSMVTAHKSVQTLVAESLLTVRQPQGCFIGSAVRRMRKTAAKPLITMLASEAFHSAVDDSLPESFIRGVRQSLPMAHFRLDYTPAEAAGPFLESYMGSHPVTPGVHAFVLGSAHISVKRFFAERHLPAVVKGNLEPGIDLPCVQRDERQIAYSATQFLLSKGHRRIAYIESDAQVAGNIQRRDGFVGALLDAGAVATAEEAERRVFRIPIAEVKLVALMRDLPRGPDRPTAVIFGQERHAAWGLRTALEARISIPAELAMLALEGGMLVEHLAPRMTAVPLKHYEGGVATGAFLAGLLKGEPITDRVYLIPAALVEGETT